MSDKTADQRGSLISEAQLCRLLETTPVRLKQAQRWGYIPKPGKGGYPLAQTVNGYVRYIASGECTREEAAELLGKSAVWVTRLVSEGYITPNERGNLTREQALSGYIRFLADEDRRSTKTAAESGLKAARQAEIEMRMAERRRDLVRRDEADASMDIVVGQINEEFGGFAARFTRDIALRRQIETAIDAALKRVATRLLRARAILASGGSDDRSGPDDLA